MHRVPVHGQPMKSVLVEPGATKGATIGTNVYNDDGSLFAPAAAATPAAGSDYVAVWSRVQFIPVNVTAVAALSTDGFVRKLGDAWTASPIVNGDLDAADTDGLAEGATNLYHTAARVLATVLTGLSTATATVITAADSVLVMAGKLQAQVSANLAILAGHTGNTANPHSVTAAQVGADPAGTAAAIVAATITNGDTTHAPSGDAVFDALAGKVSTTGNESIAGNKTFTGACLVDGAAGTFRVFGFRTSGSNRWQFTVNNAAESGGNAGSDFTLTSFTDAGANNGNALIVTRSTKHVTPGSDNLQNLGSAPLRWKEIFCGNAVINTSDAREKAVRGPLTAQELAAAQELASAGVIYQWNAAIAEKGDAARLHCSPTVQSVIAIMQAHGLDPFRYGFVCYDEWDELPEIVHSWPDEIGGAGELIRAAGSEVTQEYRPAGDRYSLRPSELESFIAAGMAHRMDALEARLTAAGF